MSRRNMNKVVIVGEGRVGKTSLTLRYCKGEYSDNQESTINASYLEKSVQVSDTDTVNIALWDTAGQEKFKSIAPMYYQEALCAIIVYDITYKESFDKVKSWVKELQEVLDTNKLILCIAGNKSDLEINRQIDKKAADDYAKSVNAHHFLTSAKNNRGIDELFLYVGQEILKRNSDKKKKTRIIINSNSIHEGNKKKDEKKKESNCC